MSLKRITLRDFVIVRSLELELQSGFTVLTGETGAGKSILIDALQLALGARAEAAVVREGAARAEVGAEFDLPAQLQPWLEAAGFEAEDRVLLLRRTVDTAGKSRAWINGSPATATQLRELGEQLLDIHGQHAWQSLTRPDSVRQLLDAYAGSDTRPVAQAWSAWAKAQQQLEHAQSLQGQIDSERERLQWQVQEVERLAPGPDEWPELQSQHTRLAHAQALLDAAQTAADTIDDEAQGVQAALGRAIHALEAQAHLEPQFAPLVEVLQSALAQVEDAGHSLGLYLRRTELDPQRLAELDARLSQWLSLARRHKRPPEELPGLLSAWKTRLLALDAAADLPALQAQVQSARHNFDAAAAVLSSSRRRAAPQLAQAITQAMQGLGMAGGRFEVQLQASTEPAAHGLESVVFLVAGHEGSTPRPVGKVASGGELSRMALAIAVTTSQLGSAQTLIFDEVDSGVGGAVAETVGRLMRQLGADRQVLAVTHLPQVAACADNHWVVSKKAEDGQTHSQVTAVTGEQRVSEIARMLGGERLSGTTLAHAREMLQGQP